MSDVMHISGWWCHECFPFSACSTIRWVPPSRWSVICNISHCSRLIHGFYRVVIHHYRLYTQVHTSKISMFVDKFKRWNFDLYICLLFHRVKKRCLSEKNDRDNIVHNMLSIVNWMWKSRLTSAASVNSYYDRFSKNFSIFDTFSA